MVQAKFPSPESRKGELCEFALVIPEFLNVTFQLYMNILYKTISYI